MDISNIAAYSSLLSQQQTADAVQTTVLKKAMDLDRQNAAQLVQAVQESKPREVEPGQTLGVYIDTHA